MTFINNKKITISLIIILILSSITVAWVLNNRIEYKEISYNEFISLIENGQIKEVNLNNTPKLSGTFSDDTEFITDNPRTVNLKEILLLNNINVTEGDGSNTVTDIVKFVLMMLFIVSILYLVNKNKSKLLQKEISEMSAIENNNDSSTIFTFNDVAGNEEAKESLKEIVDFISYPEKYHKYGARMPKGVLLYGPPGTGKTLLAKAVAGEAKVPFYAVTGSDFIQMYAGVGASRIRNLFKKAREDGKCVIFIDEIDAIGKKRSGSVAGSNDESDRTLNALLTEMSGFKGVEGIIVIAATNRIDTLDDALLRPGRFDRQVEVSLPDVNARYKILKLHSKNKPVHKKVNLNRVAKETVYFSGAKLESLMNESAMFAAKNNDEFITEEHIDKAFYSIIVGDEKIDRTSVSKEDKKITAYHEAGHALVTKLIAPNNRVTKISIIPSTKGAGGYSMNIQPDKLYQTKEDLTNSIMIAFGGRAAEELLFGENKVTTGASNDLQKATEMAFVMVSRLGMDKELGLVNYETLLNSNNMGNEALVSRIKVILDELYENTKNLLINNNDLLIKISEELIEKETLNEEEFDLLLN